MQGFMQDVRYALRQLLKSPGFASLAIVTLALGIGANTAMYTVVESVLLRPLPYTPSARLVSIGPSDGEGFRTTSWLNYQDVRNQSRTLADAAGYSEDVGVVQTHEGSVSVVTPGVTPNLFQILGARPLLGRTFVQAEGERGGPKVAVLSEGLWRQYFSSDPNIVGSTIRVNAQPRVVVGVMKSGFRFPESIGPDLSKGLWLPIQPTEEMQKERGYHFFFIVGVLKPDVTLAQLQGELGAIAKHVRESDPTLASNFGFHGASYRELLTGPVRPVLVSLTLALLLVLAIACLNVANLLIARCLGRQQEFAVRAALGAGQLRLMRQLFVEGALLSVFGCLLGTGLAYLAVLGVHKLPAGTIPRAESISLRWTVLLAVATIASITTLISSFLPAMLVARTDPQPALQGASRGVGMRSVRRRLSGWLVAAEVGLSVVLLIATGLLFHTLWNLEHARLGFDVTRVTGFTVMPANATGFSNMGLTDKAHEPASVATLTYQPVLDRIRHVPGVQDAALVTSPPFSGIDMNSDVRVVGEPNDQEHNYNAKITAVSGGYPLLMGTPVLRGRTVTEDDAAGAPYVVTINQTFARMFLRGRDPIGLQLNLGGEDTGMVKPYTIVGVIGDQVDNNVSNPPKPLLMIPYQQIPTSSLFYPALLNTVVYFVVKTNANIPIAPAMRNVFHDTAPDFALDNFQTMKQSLDQSNFSDRLGLYITGTFAGLAVLMVVAGLYGVLAQIVSYRRREIGVRLALGATRQNILVMIFRQGWMLIAAGIVCGMLASLAGGRLVQGFLFGVKTLDPWTYVGVALTLALVGTVATLIPARRAATVEPIEALREQ